MAAIVLMPRQGNTVESCVLVGWRVREGEAVTSGQILCDVETDKAVFEVPAGTDGVVLKLLSSEGDDVPVLTPIAVIGFANEDWKSSLETATNASGSSISEEKPRTQAADAGSSDRVAEDAVFGAVKRSSNIAEREALSAAKRSEGTLRASPRARSLAATEGVDPRTLKGTGPGGRVIERDVAAAAAGRPALTAAAKIAVSAGAAPPATGSALGGRVGLVDISPAKAAGTERSAFRDSTGSPAAGVEFPGKFTATPLKGVRRIISERMRASLAGSAQLTFNGSANAERVLGLRARFKASDPALGLSEITVGDLVLYAVSRVLPRFPNANATLENETLRSFESVHLALAVDTPRGLMVPVLRNADLLGLRGISAEAKRLAFACQAGNISPDELAGGTFTVSNLGALGIESFTPVLNAPQVAILGVDAITQRAVPGSSGGVVFEPRMGLSLTVDHQIIDGAPAARLLKAFADAIADIDLLLLA